MAILLVIGCINKSDRTNPHERIINVGGIQNGSRWKKSQQEAVRDIDEGRVSYSVTAGGRSVRVIVAVSPYGNRYLKTENDGAQPDNLLALPECP
jgi:hypothetical protein